MKKVEAVVVCESYSDFLCWTLCPNKQHFDRMVVVTTPKDEWTKRLCEYWHVQCVVTDAFFKDGATFNKGAGINEGLKALDGDGWVVHMDADIFLPPMFRIIFEKLPLREDCLYGIDRMMCDDFWEWLDFWRKPVLQHENDIYVHPRPFPMGVRLAKSDMDGWACLGYFQAFNQGKMKLTYPEIHTTAARGDLQFSCMFPRERRCLIPELIAIHLETKPERSGPGMGANWNGRRTPEFGPNRLVKRDEFAEASMHESGFDL